MRTVRSRMRDAHHLLAILLGGRLHSGSRAGPDCSCGARTQRQYRALSLPHRRCWAVRHTRTNRCCRNSLAQSDLSIGSPVSSSSWRQRLPQGDSAGRRTPSASTRSSDSRLRSRRSGRVAPRDCWFRAITTGSGKARTAGTQSSVRIHSPGDLVAATSSCSRREDVRDPSVMDVSPHIRLIALDTEWWVHNDVKPYGDTSPCPTRTYQEVVDSLRGALRDKGDRHAIILTHHPIRTVEYMAVLLTGPTTCFRCGW